MIDRYLAFRGQLKKPVFETDFGAHKAAAEQLYVVSPDGPSNKLTAVFGFWHASESNLSEIASRLNHRGFDALIYNLHPNILNDNPNLMQTSFEEVSRRASQHINLLKNDYGYQVINLIGISTGNIPLSMAAENLDSFDAVTMVVPGTDMLRCLWYGIRTQRIRQALEAKGFTYQELKKQWSLLAPAAHVDVLRGHRVDVLLSKADQLIPYRFGKELVDLMVEKDVNPEVKIIKRTGHALTILRYIRSL